jgi:hypothetical protein
MKGERGNLANVERETVERYALTECRYLAVMMTRLRTACNDAGIPLTSYYGAGSLAGGLIRAHGTAPHRTSGGMPQPLAEAVAAAFVGGRFESAVHGPVRRPIHETDLSSAYPSAYLSLPCLACGTWVHGADTTTDNILFRVAWSVPEGRWGPFPMRTPRLAYPLAGEGWVWGVELEAALQAFPTGTFEIKESWSYVTRCTHTPHEWVPERFRQRLAWSKEQRGIVLKLALNAIYGKYAQMIGGKPGPYTSLAWAGLITAQTRAKLLSTLTLPNAGSIVAFATDAVLSLDDLGIGSPDKTLGGWESKPPMQQGAFFVANGLVVPYGDAERVRSRGYDTRVVASALPALEAAWDRDWTAASVELTKRQFVSAKSALKMGDWNLYGEWIDEVAVQTVDPTPARRGCYVLEGVTYSLPMIRGEVPDARVSCSIERLNKTLTPSLARRALRRYEAGIRKEPLTDEILTRARMSE